MQCPNCGRKVRPDARYCDGCGEPVSVPAAASGVAEATPGSSALSGAERRQLTVMFCDLVGSTALSERLDPEDYQEWLEAYRSLCSGVVRRFDGRVARIVGDGLLIYFGYPFAHEDDPHRAIRSGLGIIHEMRALSARFGERFTGSLDVRIGIHTGLVVVGDIGAGDTLERMGTVGETPNIAARIQGAAAVNELVISDATHRLSRGFFDTESLGARELKGVRNPVGLHHVVGEAARQSRIEIAARSGLTPLVGRRVELDTLLQRWSQAVEGAGQVVMIQGEAGIGKSRLIRALRERTGDAPHSVWEGQCLPHFRASALYPVNDLLQRWLRFKRSDSDAAKLNRLVSRTARYLGNADDVSLLASMLSIPVPASDVLADLSPDVRRQKTLAAMLDLCRRSSREFPVLLVIEDLHWVDPTTMDLIGMLIGQCSRDRIMLVLTFRPEFEPPWEAKGHVGRMILERLSAEEARDMIQRVTAGKRLPAELLLRLIATTDGIPLFVEEVTKMELESGSLVEVENGYELRSALPEQLIPPTLRDSLLARLDRLKGGKAVAQLAATLGREFNFDLLAAIAPLGEPELRLALDRLVEAELLFEREPGDHTRYVFKHALIQEVAYDSILRRTRRQYHSRIAAVLAQSSSDVGKSPPELLAHHYTEAGMAEEAIEQWKRAGARATEYSAHIEAERHLRKGLELTGAVDSARRSRDELDLLIELGVSLSATKGYGHTELEPLYRRSLELSEALGDTMRSFRSRAGLYRLFLTRGEMHHALEQSRELRKLAERSESSVFVVEAEFAVGTTLFTLGRFGESLAHLENGVSLHDPDRFRLHHGNDPGLSCLLWSTCALWLLGFPDRAVRAAEQACALAHRHGRAFGLGLTYMFHAWLYSYRRDWKLVQEWAERCLEISDKHGFALYTGAATAFRGRALVEFGDIGRGIPLVEEGISLWKRTRASISVAYFSSLQAEAYALVERLDEALPILDEAIHIADTYEDRTWEAELYRLRGEFLLQQGADTGTVLACYDRAKAIASVQDARSLALRVAMSRARLMHRSGDPVAAKSELLAVYDGFREGFDSADLKEAKALACILD
jgi:class 3 adenylate cyclase/tetratricopeptide (TPR) repeat protein